MAQTNNIIMFPTNSDKEAPPQSLEDLQKRVENIRKQVAEIIVENVVGNMFKNFRDFRITVTPEYGPLFMKDVGMIIESIKSGVYRSLEFDHPLHKLNENIFELKGDNEVRLNVDALIFKKEEEKEEKNELEL